MIINAIVKGKSIKVFSSNCLYCNNPIFSLIAINESDQFCNKKHQKEFRKLI